MPLGGHAAVNRPAVYNVTFNLMHHPRAIPAGPVKLTERGWKFCPYLLSTMNVFQLINDLVDPLCPHNNISSSTIPPFSGLKILIFEKKSIS